MTAYGQCLSQLPATTEQTITTTHSNTLSTSAHPDPPPTLAPTPIICLTQPHLTVTARVLLNNTCANLTLWIPDALYKCRTPPLTPETHQLPCYPDPATDPFTLSTTVPSSIHNPPTIHYTVSTHTPAPVTHFPWQATCQCHYQHPPHIPLATNIKALTHNMQPP